MYTVTNIYQCMYACWVASVLSYSLWNCKTLLLALSVLEILQARILAWVTVPSSTGYSRPRDQTHVSLHLLHWQADSVPPAAPGKPTSVSGLFSPPCPKPQLSPLRTPVPQATLRPHTLKQRVAPTFTSFQRPQGCSQKHLRFSEARRILGNDDQICHETKLKDAPVCKHGGEWEWKHNEWELGKQHRSVFILNVYAGHSWNRLLTVFYWNTTNRTWEWLVPTCHSCKS